MAITIKRVNPEAPLDGLNDHWEPPPTHGGWWSLLIVCFAVVLVGIAVYSCAAHAHDYAHPENQKWYESLHNGDHMPCCDGNDASHIADMDWDTQCEQNNFGEQRCHYRVFLHNKWWDVPASSVLDGPNRDGSALVWEVPDWRDNELLSTHIRCFMPGAGG